MNKRKPIDRSKLEIYLKEQKKIYEKVVLTKVPESRLYAAGHLAAHTDILSKLSWGYFDKD